MSQIFLMGECMAELQEIEPGHLRQSFAGDFYNTAVYLKRAFAHIDTCLLTAVGNDKLSEAMLAHCAKEQLDCASVVRSPTRIPGLYWINTDAEGERTFTYWRENSAARQLMSLMDEVVRERLLHADWFFFSGISLAVLEPQDRPLFWALLADLKRAGVKIAFDPNYRARLWPDANTAKQNFEKAFGFCDLLLPGVDDFVQLYGLAEVNQIRALLSQFHIAEVVLKNGPAEICYIAGDALDIYPVTPASKVVDTTSAGDSFNGVFLGARMSGRSVATAIEWAARTAGLVIQHPGAIIPEKVFTDFWVGLTA
ncbi:sugar kinase [Cellvibrio sp. OA-2007]|uniref:sugar kinase n=1 Tax=Cellvibrio sp. OA-2007 TaxID=529823 RepID=UPI0007831922|nr:sugar kinase [Cellvibrio sp. OA-2007]